MSTEMATHRQYAFSQYCTVTFVITNDGVFKIDAIGHKYINQQIVDDDISTIIMKIIEKVDRPIRYVEQCNISYKTKAITSHLANLVRAVTKLEAAYVSPYTIIGRKRLLKEFELIITDE